MNRIKFSDKIREKKNEIHICYSRSMQFKVNIATYVLVYQYACAGLKTWCEKLDGKLLSNQLLLSKFNIDSEDFLCLIIKEKKAVLMIMLQSVFFDISWVR